MTAIPILLAEAVKTVINTAQAANAYTPQVFTAERSYPTWDDEFASLKNLAVDVVWVSSGSNGGTLAELDSEQSIQTEPAIDIAIRKRFEPSDREANGDLKRSSIDPLVKLVEQIYETLAGDRMQAITLASGLHANWVDTSVRTYCDYGRLRQGCFLGCVRIRFDVSKVV
jgi:hypothetical protein